jgi:hypothetical protein
VIQICLESSSSTRCQSSRTTRSVRDRPLAGTAFGSSFFDLSSGNDSIYKNKKHTCSPKANRREPGTSIIEELTVQRSAKRQPNQHQ